MRRRSRRPSRPPSRPPTSQRMTGPPNPAHYQTRRIPLCLLDSAGSGAGLTMAEIARDLRVFAAAIHTERARCHAQILQRYARQIAENRNASEAASAWTEVPQPNGLLVETAFSEITHSEITMQENEVKGYDF